MEAVLAPPIPSPARPAPEPPASIAALAEALREAPDRRGKERIYEGFLARHDLPLIAGERVTFVYRGAADAVRLRHWMELFPRDLAFERCPGTDLWALSLDVPVGSRIEYKLEIESAGRRRLLRDPTNPLRAHDPFGANSVLRMTGYERPEWSLPDSAVASGRLAELAVASRAFGETRPIQVYLPPGRRPHAGYPLLVLHDGPEYLRYAELHAVLDNLIYHRWIPPLVVALLAPGKRLVEYGASLRHSRFVADEVVPALASEIHLAPDAASRGLGGTSFGAVATLATALDRPGTFGRLLLQSGSFVTAPRRERAFRPVRDLVLRFLEHPRRPAERIFVSCGAYENLAEYNRALLPVLRATGAQVRYREALDGHHWEGWRDRLGEALPFLFPGFEVPPPPGD